VVEKIPVVISELLEISFTRAHVVTFGLLVWVVQAVPVGDGQAGGPRTITVACQISITLQRAPAEVVGTHGDRSDVSRTLPTLTAWKLVPVSPRVSMRVNGAVLKMPGLDTCTARHGEALGLPPLNSTSSFSPTAMQTVLPFSRLPIEAL
jgi:hypothetical protein